MMFAKSKPTEQYKPSSRKIRLWNLILPLLRLKINLRGGVILNWGAALVNQ